MLWLALAVSTATPTDAQLPWAVRTEVASSRLAVPMTHPPFDHTRLRIGFDRRFFVFDALDLDLGFDVDLLFHDGLQHVFSLGPRTALALRGPAGLAIGLELGLGLGWAFATDTVYVFSEDAEPAANDGVEKAHLRLGVFLRWQASRRLSFRLGYEQEIQQELTDTGSPGLLPYTTLIGGAAYTFSWGRTGA